MALGQLLGIAVRRFPLLVLGVVLPSLVTFFLTSLQPSVYQVSATLLPAQLRLAGDPDYNTVSAGRLIGLATYYSYAAESPVVLSSVGQQLDLPDPVEDLAKRVDANVDPSTGVLTITARGEDASAAARLANAVASAIEDRSASLGNDEDLQADLKIARERMLEAEAEYERRLAPRPPRSAEDTQALANALTTLRELTNVYDALSASASQTPGGLTVISAAESSRAQMIQPRTPYYTLLAAVAGLLLAAAIASILEYLDDSVKTPEEIEDVAGLPTLATIAELKRGLRPREARDLADQLYPTSGVADAYRTLRSNVEFAAADSPIRTLLITSSVSGEGKTLTAANLAVAFAQAGRRALLVDANLRKPGVHLVFDLPNAQGLTTLVSRESVSLDAIARTTSQPNLRILTSGPLPPTPTELLDSPRMRVIVERLKEGNDVVIFDGTPLEALTDSAILSSYLDATLFVVAASRTRRSAVHRGREQLARANARVIGAVLYGAVRGIPKKRDGSQARRKVPVVATGAGGHGPT